MNLISWIILILIVAAFIGAVRYTKANGTCGGCSGSKCGGNCAGGCQGCGMHRADQGGSGRLKNSRV